MRTVLRTAWWLAAAAAAQAALPAAAQTPLPLPEKGYVCWLDDRGVRACGDHVPPQYAKKQREVYDKRGLLVRTIKAEETPEQYAEEQRQTQDTQRQQEEQHKREANDKYVLETYTSLADLKAARDSRLASYDTRLDLAEKAVHAGEASLKDLQDRADVERNAGRDPSPELEAQIRSFASAQAENISAMARISQEREALAVQFQHYIELFQQVHGQASLPQATPGALPPDQAPPPQPPPKP